MQWYLNRSGRPEGPFEEAQIVQMVIEGFVPWNAMIGAKGASTWVPIIEHPPFADALSRTSQAGLPPDLSARAAAGRPPSDGTFPALDPATGSPYSAGMPISDARYGMPTLSTKKLVAIGLVMAVVVGIVSFAISRVRGGFARVLDGIGDDIVDYTIAGEPVGDDWPDAPLSDGSPNVHATDVDSVVRSLARLGDRPSARVVSIRMRLCGRRNSIELEAFSLERDVRIARVVVHPGEACDALKRDARGDVVASAAESSDRRIRILGERGIALWNALRTPDCEIAMVGADDLREVGLEGRIVDEIATHDLPTHLRDACAVATADGSRRPPFVELETIRVLVAGEDDGVVGELTSRVGRSGGSSSTFTLSAIEGGIVGR